jgi:uncharacterized protein YoxC
MNYIEKKAQKLKQQNKQLSDDLNYERAENNRLRAEVSNLENKVFAMMNDVSQFGGSVQ